jgi:hypothetical protein
MPGVGSLHEPLHDMQNSFVSKLRTDFLMKKSTLTIVCALAVTGAAFAQGIVSWASIPFNTMTAQTNVQNSPLFGGGSFFGGPVGATASVDSGSMYYYELLYNTNFTGSQVAAPNAAALFGGTWHDTGLSATNSHVAGRLSAVNPNAAAVVPWAPGTTNNIMLFGWSANMGTSWAVVSNELATGSIYAISSLFFFGESATGYTTTFPADIGPGASVFGTFPTSEGLPIFSLNTQLYTIIPEPGTILLTGLGGLSLLLFRRRK